MQTTQQSIDERLRELDSLLSQRDSLEKERDDLKRQKIAHLEEEKRQVNDEYDQQIAELKSSLSVAQHPSDVAIKAYNFLRENPGKSYTSMMLMERIHCVGAYACVALKPFLEDGRIKTDGQGRATRYYVEVIEEQ